MRAACTVLLASLAARAAAIQAIRISGKDGVSGAAELLSLSEAEARAARTASMLTAAERNTLLRGTHFGKLGPETGYYVGYTPPVPRLGIPALKMQDAGNGFRPTDPQEEGTTTCWPSLLAMAATWDEQMVGQVARAIGEEFVGKGSNVILGPSINVHRVARNGRNFEYLSGEDPYLGARLTDAYVRGVQGAGVMAVAKHFAFNEQETQRMSESSNVDERTAWELYYPPFEAAVNAGAGSFMCSYNKVNGTWASENTELLQRDLKTKMGFRGFVMSDWFATHKPLAVERGLDQEMPGVPTLPFPKSLFAGYFHNFNDSALNAPHRAQRVHEAATRVLTSIYRLNLDKYPSCTPPDCAALRAANVTSDEHRALARLAATSSVTLLKNAGDILPLDTTRVKNIAILGNALKKKKFMGGGGSGKVPSKNAALPYDYIRARAATAGIRAFHAKSVKEINASTADLAVIVAGTLASEGYDRKSLSLDDDSDELISNTARKVPTIVLMQTPGAVLTPWRDEAAAIANMFFGGEGTGPAWASVLFGDATPTGKLPIMMPLTEEDDTIAPSKGTVPYSEGLFTSYRSPVFRSAFPFGHGLSFTSFDFGQPQVVACPSRAFAACISLTVKNVGRRPGAEVVQAYLEFEPAAKEPARVLRNYHKTRLLQPGEAEPVVLMFTPRDLSAYVVGQGWVPYHSLVHLGASSADIRHTVQL